MIIAGIVLVTVFTRRITGPIVRLTEISSKMANLDFEAKYDSKGINEVDVLGENINEMSEKLENNLKKLNEEEMKKYFAESKIELTPNQKISEKQFNENMPNLLKPNLNINSSL